MTAPTVALPRLVGLRSLVAGLLVQHREEPVVSVSFRDTMSISASAISEVIMAGTNSGTRPLYLVAASPGVREAVEDFLRDEPIFRPFVHYGLAPEPEPAPADPPTLPDTPALFAVGQALFTRDAATALRDDIDAWLAATDPASTGGTGWPQ